MGGIFISYRRDDSGPYAGRLRDTLGQHFGAEQVFRDVDSVDPGERFPRLIEQQVGSCDALLALIGPTWQTITDDAGQRRLDDPQDFVRLEIAAALGRGDDVLVIPVLVGSTSMPAAADLPKPLDLRHSGAVLAAQAGATLAELMNRLGHSTPQAALRYQHTAHGRDQAIAEKMSELNGG